MKKEEKLLVIKDLCARQPYGVRVKHGRTISVLSVNIMFDIIAEGTIPKPYLRPSSSMTEEEKKELYDMCDVMYHFGMKLYDKTPEFYDWLNAHHFDYRGLIEMNLAIEAPEGMYNI